TGSTFSADIASTVAGSGYDQVTANGTVNINTNSALVLNLGAFIPNVGDSFTLLHKTSAGTITGNFAGLPEGTAFVSGGRLYRITYAGNGGNDIVVSRTGIYVEADWSGFAANQAIADADPIAAGNQPAAFGVNAFASVNAALTAANGFSGLLFRT